MSASTGLVCLLGHPVSHSLSPSIHNAAFRAQCLDLVYLAFDVTPRRLRQALLGLRALGARGANLTIPHKEAVLPLLDEIDPAAARVGAVNTVVNDQSRLRGYNTDVSGFLAALRTLRPEGSRGTRCLVLGAGGAARAVVAALASEEAGEIWIVNRTHERAASLCQAARSWGGSQCEAVPAGAAPEVLLRANLVVNATSVGLTQSVKELPVDVDTLHSGHVVVDLVYGSRPTELVEAARARGARAMDGREMLVMQAADSYRLWTGREPPVEVMRASLERWER